MQQNWTKEYKTWYVWVGNAIQWEVCKKFKYYHSNKWCMRNPASVLEDDTHKSYLISARKENLIVIAEKKSELTKLWTLLTRLTTE